MSWQQMEAVSWISKEQTERGMGTNNLLLNLDLLNKVASRQESAIHSMLYTCESKSFN